MPKIDYTICGIYFGFMPLRPETAFYVTKRFIVGVLGKEIYVIVAGKVVVACLGVLGCVFRVDLN